MRRADHQAATRIGDALVLPGPTLARRAAPDLAALLPDAFDALPPCYVADANGVVLHANRAYRRLAEQLHGAAATPEPLLALDEVIAEIAASDGRLARHLSFAHPVAMQLRVEHVGQFAADGTLQAVIGTATDVTDLVTTRHKLALTRERLDDITRLSSDLVWETDTRLAVTFVTPRISEVLGFQPVEVIGRSFLSLGRFTGEAKPGQPAPLDPQLRAPFRDLPWTMTHRDGSHRLFQVSALPVFCSMTGDFLGFRGTARDVTEQAEAFSRAAQSQTQLTQALESISEGFALFDPEDRLVLCNRKFRESFTSIGDQILPGLRFADFLRTALESGSIAIPTAERAAWMESRLKLRAQERASFELQLGDGRWIKISDHKTADGSTVGIRTDITDLKLREDALFAAKETAEIASRSKSEFLANISHELRTPLNAIIGFSEIMREEIFGPLGSAQYREYIGDVLDSAHHLLEVINDILDIAKAEAGKLELAEDDVDVAAVVRSAARLVQERAQRGQIAIRSALGDNLPTLHADERKLKQILLNLLTNSVKFTPAGGTIEVGARYAENGDFLITVTDSGIGIAEEHIATALAPFGQVDSKLNRKYEGTGLGLPLSSAMMRLHSGDLSIASTVGQGTVVTLRFPASRVQAQPALAQ
jgi:PAS domain S-box-containing protein